MSDAAKLLRAIASGLDVAPRIGAATDQPEGARYLIMSDTLARQISSDCLAAAAGILLETPR